ncbi:sugar transferase [Streptococcus suis]|uniref:sugar transferase n=1 Tax=Streptococcus suis TaxID=1307 RepID=UPI000CF4CD70|nr:sugar transferase [Streptococcus suis]
MVLYIRNEAWSKFATIIESIFVVMVICMTTFTHQSVEINETDINYFLLSLPWVIIFYIVLNKSFDTHVYYNRTIKGNILNSFFVQTFFLIGLSIVGFLFLDVFRFSLVTFLICLVLGTLLSSVIHIFIFRIYETAFKRKRLLILGQKSAVLATLKNFQDSSETLHKVTHLVFDHYLESIKEVVDEIDVVYIAGYIDSKTRLAIYEFLISHNKILYLTTNVENSIVINSHMINISDESMIQVTPYYLSVGQAAIKRVLDFLTATLLLCLSSPIFILTAILIKLESPGPIFYRQDRVTKGNRVFSILKFRSMKADAERSSGPVLAQANDNRVTRVGEFIRRTRIDELPQLINVLKGDMSMVGPRPERPYFVEQFVKQNGYYSLRHNVRAGITGYAQVYGKYTSDFQSKLKFDLLYIKQYSILLDIKLLLKTFVTLLDKTSSQGQSKENIKEIKIEELSKTIRILS